MKHPNNNINPPTMVPNDRLVKNLNVGEMMITWTQEKLPENIPTKENTIQEYTKQPCADRGWRLIKCFVK